MAPAAGRWSERPPGARSAAARASAELGPPGRRVDGCWSDRRGGCGAFELATRATSPARCSPPPRWRHSCTRATSMSTRGSGSGVARRGSRRAARWRRRGRGRRVAATGRRGLRRRRRELHEVGRHQAEESVAQMLDEALGDCPGIVADVDEASHRRQRPALIVVDERLDEVVERQFLAERRRRRRRAPPRGDQLKRRQGVVLADSAGVTAASTAVGRHVEAGVGSSASTSGRWKRRCWCVAVVSRPFAGRWWRARTRRRPSAAFGATRGGSMYRHNTGRQVAFDVCGRRPRGEDAHSS